MALVTEGLGAVQRVRSTAVGRLGRRVDPGAFNLRTQHLWTDRAEAAVDLWLRHDTSLTRGSGPVDVSDLGAGSGVVGRLLSQRTRPRVTYRGYDLLPQSNSIVQLDVRRGLPPNRAHVVFCLGLLEYLPADDPIINRLAQHARFAVVSYSGLQDTMSPLVGRWRLHKRRGLQWVRHQTNRQFCGAFADAGFECVASTEHSPGSSIWLWQAS